MVLNEAQLSLSRRIKSGVERKLLINADKIACLTVTASVVVFKPPAVTRRRLGSQSPQVEAQTAAMLITTCKPSKLHAGHRLTSCACVPESFQEVIHQHMTGRSVHMVTPGR